MRPTPVGPADVVAVRTGPGRGRRAQRVLVGLMLMAGFVIVALTMVVRHAGGWGVPYFTFRTDRGSSCVNNFTGYVCSPTNLADVEYFGDIDLPDDTRVLTGTYTSTHDYQLESNLEVPARSQAKALKALTEAFGRCIPDHPSPISTRGLTQVCVLANDGSVIESGEPAPRLYTVGTGLRKDGTRLIGLSIRSR